VGWKPGTSLWGEQMALKFCHPDAAFSHFFLQYIEGVFFFLAVVALKKKKKKKRKPMNFKGIFCLNEGV